MFSSMKVLLAAGAMGIVAAIGIVAYFLGQQQVDTTMDIRHTEHQISKAQHDINVANAMGTPVDPELEEIKRKGREKLKDLEARQAESRKITDGLTKEGVDALAEQNGAKQ